MLRFRQQIDATIHTRNQRRAADQLADARRARLLHRAVDIAAALTTGVAAIAGPGGTLATTHHAALAERAGDLARSTVKRAIIGVDAASRTQAAGATTRAGGDRVALRTQLIFADGLVAGAAMQGIAREVDAATAAGGERRTGLGVESRRRIRGCRRSVSGCREEIVRQRLRTAHVQAGREEDGRPDSERARAPKQP
jgi:hypothetical protein